MSEQLPGQLDALNLLGRPSPDRSRIDCPECGHTHKHYMRHCTCSRASLFVNPATGLCLNCTQHPHKSNPTVRTQKQ